MTDLMTRKEVAEYFGMSIRTIDYLVASKQLPFFRIGPRLIRFSKTKIKEHLERLENKVSH